MIHVLCTVPLGIEKTIDLVSSEINNQVHTSRIAPVLELQVQPKRLSQFLNLPLVFQMSLDITAPSHSC